MGIEKGNHHFDDTNIVFSKKGIIEMLLFAISLPLPYLLAHLFLRNTEIINITRGWLSWDMLIKEIVGGMLLCVGFTGIMVLGVARNSIWTVAIVTWITTVLAYMIL